jgi:hypothetical protein
VAGTTPATSAQKWVFEEGTHIKYCSTAHDLKLFYLSVPIDDRNSKLEWEEEESANNNQPHNTSADLCDS